MNEVMTFLIGLWLTPVVPVVGVPLMLLGGAGAILSDRARADRSVAPPPPPRAPYVCEPWEQKANATAFRVRLENEIMTAQERDDWLGCPERWSMSVISWFRIRRGLTGEQVRKLFLACRPASY